LCVCQVGQEVVFIGTSKVLPGEDLVGIEALSGATFEIESAGGERVAPRLIMESHRSKRAPARQAASIASAQRRSPRPMADSRMLRRML